MGIAFTSLGFDKDEYPKVTVRQELHFFKRWSFEELRATFEQFLAMESFTLNLHEFWKIFDFPSRRDAEAAFKFFNPRQGRVDFMTIMCPMIILSDMSRISKVSFLFSMVDFDGSGLVSHPEFCILLEGLVKGLAKFFKEMKPVKVVQIEQCAKVVFQELDKDNSKYIDIHEMTAFAYRSREINMLMTPFHGKDKRLFEDAIPFRALKDGQIKKWVEQKQSKFEDTCSARAPKIKVDGEPARRRNARSGLKNKRPWRKPTSVTPAAARILWLVFSSLDDDNDNVVGLDVIQEALEWGGKIHEWRRHYRVEDDNDPDDLHFEGKSNMDAVHLFNRLNSPEFLERVQEAKDSVSLQGFTVMTWPRINASEVRCVIAWMQKFKAEQVLTDIFKSVQTGVTEEDLTTDDIKYLFQCMDVNKDGVLSVQEMIADEVLSEQEAQKVIYALDYNNNGKLTLQETMQVVLGKDVAVGAFADGLKAGFAAAQMR